MRYLIAFLIFLVPAQAFAEFCSNAPPCSTSMSAGAICTITPYYTYPSYPDSPVTVKLSSIQWEGATCSNNANHLELYGQPRVYLFNGGGGADCTGTGASAVWMESWYYDSANFTCPQTCSSFTYSEWGECQSNGTQTRSVLTSSPSGCVGGSPVLSQSCQYTQPHCSNGVQDLAEMGIDCGGGENGCPGECVTWCPDGYSMEGSTCTRYIEPDASGNCPVPLSSSGTPVVISKASNGDCRYVTNGISSLSPEDGGSAPSNNVGYNPVISDAELALRNEHQKTITALQNGNTQETITDTYEMGEVTVSSTAIQEKDSSGNILSSVTESDVTLPPEANWDNYNFNDADALADNDASALQDSSVWGAKPDWNQAPGINVGPYHTALEGSELQLFQPTPVLINSNFHGKPIYISLEKWESNFRSAGFILVAITYVFCLVGLCRGR